ncbi:MAG TPA: hypothetical protein PLR06_09425 [Cyclobacteriaceae bacterium]|nr:hypothetical protein [Cyclobacteriaceae bacterium]
MKTLIVNLLLLLSLPSFAQQYTVGLIKEGTTIKIVTGEINISDKDLTLTIDSIESKMTIVKRDGFTIHVTDGTVPSKYVITHAKGRLHGFTYNCSIKHERDHHSKVKFMIYYCTVKKD